MGQQNNSQIPLSLIWDVARLYSVDVNTPEFKELLVRLYQYINSIAIAVNDRDVAVYVPQEYVTGQQYFPNPSLMGTASTSTQSNRGTFRKVINFGALPNAGTKSVPHYIFITEEVSITRIYASATEPSTLYIPIPYVSTTGDDIELYMDAVNVNIVTLSDRTNFETCYVVIEYLKQ